VILVTGGTGHIGNVLVRMLLRQGKQVRVFLLRGESPAPLRGLPVETAEGDILDSSSLFRVFDGIRGVFHLAGLISILPGANPRVEKVNIEGTHNILQAAKEAGIEKLVYISSIHAIQRAEKGLIDESLPYDPANPYGAYDRSKAQATLEVLRAAQEGLPAVVVCPTGVVGPYDFRGSMMGEVIRAAAEQKPALYVDGGYDFVDVRDVGKGLIAAFEKGRVGQSYILSGHRISVRYLLETVREITGRPFLQLKIPFGLARFAARFTPPYYKLFHITPRFTSYSLSVLHSNTNISHAKATRELGYHPRSIYQTIADTVHWFLNLRNLSPSS
jgi:dihydroflavonol-4-reductase